MPTHYQAASDPSHFAQRFGIGFYPQRSVVRPGDQGLFVRRPRTDGPTTDPVSRYQIAPGRWGLIPLFSKDGLEADTFEARAESAAAERMFYQPWKRGHRCVVLADALFQPGDDEGTTVRVSRLDGQPLALAGLWNGWRSPTGECVESFALLTFALPGAAGPDGAGSGFAPRRTAILRDAWIDDWLHCPVEETAAYLRPYADDKLVRRAMPVGEIA